MATCNYQNDQEYCHCNNKVLEDYNYCQLHIKHQKPQIERRIEKCDLCKKSFDLADKFFNRYKILQCGCVFHKKCIYKNLECNVTNPCTCPICEKYCYIPDLVLTDYQISVLLFKNKMKYHILFKENVHCDDYTIYDCENWIRSIESSSIIPIDKKTQKQVNEMMAYNTSTFEYMLSYLQSIYVK